MKKPKGFFTYFHHSNIVSMLSDTQAGQLYKALLNYGDTGELNEFPDDQVVGVVYAVMRAEIDVNFERYDEICRKRSEAAKARRKKNEANADNCCKDNINDTENENDYDNEME